MSLKILQHTKLLLEFECVFIKYYNTAGKYSLFLSRYSSITIIDLIVKLRKHSLKKA